MVLLDQTGSVEFDAYDSTIYTAALSSFQVQLFKRLHYTPFKQLLNGSL